MRAQGYVAAQDRFFEMDVRRHITAGRLASCSAARPSRPTSSSARMGWRAYAGPRARRCWSRAPAPPCRRTPTGSTPTSRPHSPSRISLEYTLLAAKRSRLPPRAVDRRSTPWLAQGDGVGPARQHGRRDRPRARPRRPHSEAEVESLYPAYDYRAAPADRRPGGGGPRDVFELDASAPGTRPPQRPAYDRGAAGRAARPPARPSPTCPSPVGSRRRDRQSTAGSSTVTTPPPASRCWPTTRTSGSACPAIWMQIGLHCTTVEPGCPARRLGLHLLRGPWGGDRPQRHRWRGASPTSGPMSATSTSSRSGATAGATAGGGCRCASGARPSSAGRRRRRDQRAVDGARPDSLRRLLDLPARGRAGAGGWPGRR